MTNPKVTVSLAKSFADENLEQLCRDVIVWQESGVLPDSARLRELGELVSSLSYSGGHLLIAQDFVHRAAIRRIAGR